MCVWGGGGGGGGGGEFVHCLLNSEATTKSCSYSLVRSRNGTGLSAVVQLEIHIISKSRSMQHPLTLEEVISAIQSFNAQVESSSQHPILYTHTHTSEIAVLNTFLVCRFMLAHGTAVGLWV